MARTRKPIDDTTGVASTFRPHDRAALAACVKQIEEMKEAHDQLLASLMKVTIERDALQQQLATSANDRELMVTTSDLNRAVRRIRFLEGYRQRVLEDDARRCGPRVIEDAETQELVLPIVDSGESWWPQGSSV